MDPCSFDDYSKSDLATFLLTLSSIYEKSSLGNWIHAFAEREFNKLSRVYRTEQLYLLSMASYFDYNKNSRGRVSELSPIRSIYPPAEYMCQFFEKGRTTNEMYTIVSTRIEKYTSLGEHIKFVVEHLDDKKFV